jgi:serine/threonine-protein kinase
VTDVGTLDTGAPYMVMEYLEGGDLSAWVQQRGALPVEQAVEFVLQACDAIADAHSLGIVHRDLKPANLFCIQRNDGFFSVKVLDFGISKVTGLGPTGPHMGMTKTSAVMGSPHYMSPEQMQSSRAVDARTDIWSLGVILYELLAGEVPFSGDTLPEVCVKIATQQPPPLRDRRPDAPGGIEEVILKCLKKDRLARYSNVAELAVALAPFGPKRVRALVERITRVIQAAGMSASALALPPSDQSVRPPAPGTMASWGHTAPEASKRSTGMRVGFAAGLIGVAGIAAALFVLRRPPNVATAAQAPAVVTALTGATTTTAVPAAPTTAPSASAVVEPVPSAAPPEAPKPVGRGSAVSAAAPRKGPVPTAQAGAAPAPRPATRRQKGSLYDER